MFRHTMGLTEPRVSTAAPEVPAAVPGNGSRPAPGAQIHQVRAGAASTDINASSTAPQNELMIFVMRTPPCRCATASRSGPSASGSGTPASPSR